MTASAQSPASAGAAPPRAPARGGLAGWQVRRLTQILEGDLRALTVAQMAREVRLSPKHFSRAFSASMGLSPSHRLIQARVERAAELLTGTDLPVSEIARRVGYRSAPQLTRAFSARYGEPPSSYRRA